jgi:hypothetical protein
MEGPALGVRGLEGRPLLGIVRPKRNYGAASGWPATHGLAKASGEVVCRGVGLLLRAFVLVAEIVPGFLYTFIGCPYVNKQALICIDIGN